MKRRTGIRDATSSAARIPYKEAVLDKVTSKFVEVWYRDAPPPRWLRCLEMPYRAWVRRRGDRPDGVPPVPVIVVGNITAGGTGKTPLVIRLVQLMAGRGFKPGVISRGYGGKRRNETLKVGVNTRADAAGDEPCLIHARTGAPVWVDRRRARALSAAVDAGVDIVISDDGLQHRALPRTLEICVVDGVRRLGNGRMLPAGPLREPASRLETVDFAVGKGRGAGIPGEFVMRLTPSALRRLSDGERFPPAYFSGREISAIAGIGRPEGFFDTLHELGCRVARHPRPDHHRFGDGELNALDKPVVMTEKDAVRLPADADLEGLWALEVDATLPADFDAGIMKVLGSRGEMKP